MASSLNNSVAELFAPRRLSPPVDWIQEHCVLRDNISELPGALKLFPYAHEPVNNLINPHVSKITLCFGSQSSKTTTIYSGVAYLLSEFPKDTLWIMPSAENARNFSKGRWLPFLEDCKPLRNQCPLSAATGRIDTDKITNMRQEFIPCTLTFTGAGSENNVKSAPVAYLVLDEIDEIDSEIRMAALERIKGRREYKIIQTSTPKEEDSGIWSEYLNGDQRVYFMPCPHCGEMIDFQWRQKDCKEPRYGIGFDPEAKFEDESGASAYDFDLVARTAHYRCQCCDGKILDAHKPAMLKAGEWRSTNPHAPTNHRSYHLSSMYAPAISFSDLIVKWLQVSRDQVGLKKFIQGELAEPWREDWGNQDQADANQLEQDYQRGDLMGQYRILSVDTQTDHYRYVARGYDNSGESWLIDYGTAAGFPELDKLFEQFSCHRGIIDSGGNRTQEVYEEVYKRRSKWIACKGFANMAEPYRMNRKDPFTGDTKGRGGGRAKILMLNIDKNIWEPEIAQLRSRKLSGFHTFADTPKDYYDQLFGAYWVREPDRSGHIKTKRKIKRCGDHYFDCECQARALSKFIGLARVDRPADSNPIDQPPKQKQKRDRSTRNSSAAAFWN